MISVTVVSIMRLRFLITFGKGSNPTWDQSDVVDWSTIEVNVGMICASMPTMRLIFARFLPKLFTSTKSNSVTGATTYVYNNKRNDGTNEHASMGSEIELTNKDCESLKEVNSGI